MQNNIWSGKRDQLGTLRTKNMEEETSADTEKEGALRGENQEKTVA